MLADMQRAADAMQAAHRLGCKVRLERDGPVFSLPDRSRLNEKQWTALRQLRLVMSRHRDQIIKHLGGNPEDYTWMPSEGTDEREWYDYIVDCSKDESGGISVGQSGREWDHVRDSRRLLASCRNTEEWKKEARCFWWDTQHAKSWRPRGPLDWPLVQG